MFAKNSKFLLFYKDFLDLNQHLQQCTYKLYRDLASSSQYIFSYQVELLFHFQMCSTVKNHGNIQGSKTQLQIKRKLFRLYLNTYPILSLQTCLGSHVANWILKTPSVSPQTALEILLQYLFQGCRFCYNNQVSKNKVEKNLGKTPQLLVVGNFIQPLPSL